MDWLTYIVQGGSIVLLAVVLFGVWKIAGQLLEMLKAQSEYIRISSEVQTRLCERIQQSERRAEDRHDEIMQALEVRAPKKSVGVVR